MLVYISEIKNEVFNLFDTKNEMVRVFFLSNFKANAVYENTYFNKNEGDDALKISVSSNHYVAIEKIIKGQFMSIVFSQRALKYFLNLFLNGNIPEFIEKYNKYYKDIFITIDKDEFVIFYEDENRGDTFELTSLVEEDFYELIEVLEDIKKSWFSLCLANMNSFAVFSKDVGDETPRVEKQTNQNYSSSEPSPFQKIVNNKPDDTVAGLNLEVPEFDISSLTTPSIDIEDDIPF